PSSAVAGRRLRPMTRSMILLDERAASFRSFPSRARRRPTAMPGRLRRRQSAPRPRGLPLRGQPRGDLHVLSQPQLSMRRPGASPRSLLPAHLEGGRQDHVPAAVGPRGGPVQAVDRQPPPARVRDPADAGGLPASRRVPVGRHGSALPRPDPSPPGAPLTRLRDPEHPGYRSERTISRGSVPPPTHAYYSKVPVLQGISSSSESRHTQLVTKRSPILVTLSATSSSPSITCASRRSASSRAVPTVSPV